MLIQRILQWQAGRIDSRIGETMQLGTIFTGSMYCIRRGIVAVSESSWHKGEIRWCQTAVVNP